MAFSVNDVVEAVQGPAGWGHVQSVDGDQVQVSWSDDRGIQTVAASELESRNHLL